MKLLQWKPAFSLGIPCIDLEHRHMMEQINDTYSRLSDDADRTIIEAMLGEIHAGIAAHFALEEQLMRAAAYPEYAAHKADHEGLLDQILDLMDVYAADPAAGEQQLREHLSDWFGNHFASFDARLHGALG